MPHLTSNISSKMFYFAFGEEIFRTARTTSKWEKCCSRSDNLIARMPNQGGDVIFFARTLTKVHGRHFQIFRKFYNASDGFGDSLTKQQGFWTGLYRTTLVVFSIC